MAQNRIPIIDLKEHIMAREVSPLSKELSDAGNSLRDLTALTEEESTRRAKVWGNASRDITALAEEELEDIVRSNICGIPMISPLLIKRPEEILYWLFPMEPVISITGKNIIVSRNVGKSSLRGSIKERWAQDDYSITIKGVFVRQGLLAYPKADVQRLRYYCESPTELDVQCRLFEIFGINKMVVNSFHFPFTSGENNQSFTIMATSDNSQNLFIELNEEEA